MLKDFGEIAKKLSNNPLGIIALFIVLVYGIAALVLNSAVSVLTTDERIPLVWFLVLFPIIVLGTFAWLVAQHHAKLYAPRDFPDPSVFLRTLPPEAQRQKIEAEVAEIRSMTINVGDLKSPTTLSEARPNAPEIRSRLMLVEDLVLREVASEIQGPLNRQVAFADVAFDGFYLDAGEAVGVEVKYYQEVADLRRLVESLGHASQVVRRYGWKHFKWDVAIVLEKADEDTLLGIALELQESIEDVEIPLHLIRTFSADKLFEKYGVAPFVSREAVSLADQPYLPNPST